MSKDPLHDELLFALRGLGRNLGWAYMQGGFSLPHLGCLDLLHKTPMTCMTKDGKKQIRMTVQ
jgi:hypothetical protein